ncbi:MAG: hypothetical protein HY744_10170 [Deltaproteobacteria bacterium]|nr:hypothetical protein [Deltaproteobacteria bacterium]
MMRQVGKAAAVLLALLAVSSLAPPSAQAQELQITGPLAGAPAVRRLRLRRDSRFDVAPAVSFTLLDEYRRTIMPGLRATYHFTDWLGAGLFGGYGFQYNASLTDELQAKAIDDRNCQNNPHTLPCKRSAVSLCRGSECLADKQLARLQWLLVPQVTFIPFRGKVSLFSVLFVDTDISIFLGPAIVGLQQRKDCAEGTCAQDSAFELESGVTVSPSGGMGLNFYPSDFISFGAELRLLPYSWNTSGFDVSGPNDVPDNVIDGDDRAFQFNSMLTVFVGVQLPTAVVVSD